MFRKTALLVVGMLAAGSLPTLAAQQAPPMKKPVAQQPVSTAKPATAKPAAPHWTAAQIREAQAALIGLKLYTGKETGTMNVATEEGLRQFQRAHNLPVTGNLSDSTLALLKSSKPAAPAVKK